MLRLALGRAVVRRNRFASQSRPEMGGLFFRALFISNSLAIPLETTLGANDRSYEPIALSGYRLNKSRLFGVVFEYLPDLTDCTADAVSRLDA